MLSYKNTPGSKAVARIVIPGMGKKVKSRLVYLNTEANAEPEYKSDEDSSSESEDPFDPVRVLDDDDFKYRSSAYRTMTAKDEEAFIRALRRKKRPKKIELHEAYSRATKKMADKIGLEIKINAGTMSAVPDTDAHACYYVTGRSGSGKSFWSARFAIEYMVKYPKRRVHLFSRHDAKKDKAYAGLPVEHYKLDEEFEDFEFDLDDKYFNNCLIIFDDTDNLPNKAIQTKIEGIRDDVVTNGRKYGVTTVFLSHIFMGGNKTRLMLTEATHVIFFKGSHYHSSNFMKKYAGYDAKTIAKVGKLPSRWILCSTNHPSYVLYETGCFIVQ